MDNLHKFADIEGEGWTASDAPSPDPGEFAEAPGEAGPKPKETAAPEEDYQIKIQDFISNLVTNTTSTVETYKLPEVKGVEQQNLKENPLGNLTLKVVVKSEKGTGTALLAGHLIRVDSNAAAVGSLNIGAWASAAASALRSILPPDYQTRMLGAPAEQADWAEILKKILSPLKQKDVQWRAGDFPGKAPIPVFGGATYELAVKTDAIAAELVGAMRASLKDKKASDIGSAYLASAPKEEVKKKRVTQSRVDELALSSFVNSLSDRFKEIIPEASRPENLSWLQRISPTSRVAGDFVLELTVGELKKLPGGPEVFEAIKRGVAKKSHLFISALDKDEYINDREDDSNDAFQEPPVDTPKEETVAAEPAKPAKGPTGGTDGKTYSFDYTPAEKEDDGKIVFRNLKMKDDKTLELLGAIYDAYGQGTPKDLFKAITGKEGISPDKLLTTFTDIFNYVGDGVLDAFSKGRAHVAEKVKESKQQKEAPASETASPDAAEPATEEPKTEEPKTEEPQPVKPSMKPKDDRKLRPVDEERVTYLSPEQQKKLHTFFRAMKNMTPEQLKEVLLNQGATEEVAEETLKEYTSFTTNHPKPSTPREAYNAGWNSLTYMSYLELDEKLTTEERRSKLLEFQKLKARERGMRKVAYGQAWAGPSLEQIGTLIGAADAAFASELAGALAAKFDYISFPPLEGSPLDLKKTARQTALSDEKRKWVEQRREKAIALAKKSLPRLSEEAEMFLMEETPHEEEEYLLPQEEITLIAEDALLELASTDGAEKMDEATFEKELVSLLLKKREDIEKNKAAALPSLKGREPRVEELAPEVYKVAHIGRKVKVLRPEHKDASGEIEDMLFNVEVGDKGPEAVHLYLINLGGTNIWCADGEIEELPE